MGRKLPVFTLVCALVGPGPASAQIARLPSVFAGVPVVVAPPVGLSVTAGLPVLAAVPALDAAPAAAPLAAAAPPGLPTAVPAPVSAARTLGAVAAGSPALADPSRSADGEKAEAGRSFDLSAARSAPAAADLGGTPGPPFRPLAAGRRRADAPSSVGEPAAPSSPRPAHRFALQLVARLQTLAQRALGFPAHFWPFSSLARFVAHGEPLVGLTPAAAARAVESLSVDGGVVIGRLAWELRDPWSIRGAERSYLSLIDKLGKLKARRPELDVAVSIDAESLGLDLRGASPEERLRAAAGASLRIARAAKARGLPLEIDMGTADAMPSIIAIAARVVRETGRPMRLALAARYRSSRRALLDWAALARETGLKLGVRLVKGSFIEGNRPDAVNLRGPLIERYKANITLALERSRWLDVAVASQNEEIWEHAQAEARRLGAEFKMHVIRGVNLSLQAKMRAAGKIGRVYVSYGVDAVVMGLTELYTNWKQKRALAKRTSGRID